MRTRWDAEPLPLLLLLLLFFIGFVFLFEDLVCRKRQTWIVSVAVPSAEQGKQMHEKIGERCDKCRHVGPSCRVENLRYSQALLASLNEAKTVQHEFGAAGGIKLHRQRNEIERHQYAPGDRHDHQSSFRGQQPGKHAEERNPHDQLAGKAGHAYRRHAQLQRCIGVLVLDGVATFVRSHAQCRGGGSTVIGGGQHKALPHRVVVVVEELVVLDNGDIVDPGLSQQLVCGLCARAAGEGRCLIVTGVGAPDVPIGQEADGHSEDKNYQKHSVLASVDRLRRVLKPASGSVSGQREG